MNKKWIIIGVLSVAIISTLGYLYYRKNKKPNNNNKLDLEPVKLEKSPQVDNKSQAVKITEKKLSQFNETLSHYEYKNNSLYDKDTGGKISENAGWGVWGLLNRNYNSLLSGVNNDTSINKETKEYSLNVLIELKKVLDKTFPPEIYHTSSTLFKKYNLDKIKENNIYNEKV
jgi:hypothetical protein